jgi:hypothetical protein
MLATEQRQLLMPAPKSWGKAIDAAKPIPDARPADGMAGGQGGGRIPRPAGAALPQRQEGLMADLTIDEVDRSHGRRIWTREAHENSAARWRIGPGMK